MKYIYSFVFLLLTAAAVAQTYQRNYEVAGATDVIFTERVLDFHVSPEGETYLIARATSPETSFFILAKLAADGEPIWAKRIENNRSVFSSGVRILPDEGGVVLYLPDYGAQNLLYWFDAAGELTQSSSFALSVIVDEINGEEQVGSFASNNPRIGSSGNVILPYFGGVSDFALVELNGNGTQTTRQGAWRAENFLPSRFLQPTADGGFVLLGYSPEDISMLIGVVNMDGQLRWQRNLSRFTGSGFSSTLTDDLLIVDGELSEGTAVVAFNLSDGSLAWGKFFPYTGSEDDFRFGDGYFAPTVIAADGNSVFLLQDNPDTDAGISRWYYALDLQTGAIQSVREFAYTPDQVPSANPRPDSYARIESDGAGGTLLAEVSQNFNEGLEIVRLTGSATSGCVGVPNLIAPDNTTSDFIPRYGERELSIVPLNVLRVDRFKGAEVDEQLSISPVQLTLTENCTAGGPLSASDSATLMELSPNPAFRSVTVTVPTGMLNKDVTMELLDFNGRRVLSLPKTITSPSVLMELPALRVGVYFLRVNDGEQMMTQRLMIGY